MDITLNGTRFSQVRELNIKREPRRTDVRYNTQGDMLIDMVSRKYLIEVSFGMMTAGELSALREITENIFVTVELDSPEGILTRDFHIEEEPASCVTSVNGVTVYSGVKLVMKEK